MPKTLLSVDEVIVALFTLGYMESMLPPGADFADDEVRAAVRQFQRDAGGRAGQVDGWYGPKTEAALKPLSDAIKKAPCGLMQMRRWQQTYYYVGSASPGQIPMMSPDGKLLAKVSPGSFVEAALEGTTKLPSGTMLNVASNPTYRPQEAGVMAPVYQIAKRNGWLPDKAGYAGIRLSADGAKVTGARTFMPKKTGDRGWPVEAKGIEMDPFRTLAADNGRLRRHDPAFKGEGGVVPAGTRVWIAEWCGVKLPGNFGVHDGWFTVNDTGGGIYGAHFDIFTGSRTLAKQMSDVLRASVIHIWFEGVEERLPYTYSYGLR